MTAKPSKAPAAVVLRRLRAKWTGTCPVCRGVVDIAPGKDARIVLTCAGGCSPAAILGALGCAKYAAWFKQGGAER